VQRLARRAIVMHGHRHIDWIGRCGRLVIVSAPSPVMEARDTDMTAFYIHTLGVDAAGRYLMAHPERVEIAGEQEAINSASAKSGTPARDRAQ
jgi:hypothetical protein